MFVLDVKPLAAKLNSLNIGEFRLDVNEIDILTPDVGNISPAEIIWCGQFVLYYDECSQVFFADEAAVVRFFEWVNANPEKVYADYEIEGCEYPGYENGDRS